MTEQLTEAALLLGVGMSVVFAFLTLLIGGIHSIAWFCRVFPEPVPVKPNARPNLQDNNNPKTTVSPQIASAIKAAINTHRFIESEHTKNH